MLIYGKNAVFEYLKFRPRDVKIVYSADEKITGQIKGKFNGQIKLTDKKNIERMLNSDNCIHQNIAAEISITNIVSLDELLNKINSSPKKNKNILILDHLNDPQNFGAIIRSAAFFNIGGIIIAKDRQTPINATVIKASSGMTALIDFALVANINAALTRLKKEGYWIYSAVSDAGEPLETVKINTPVALVVGNEGTGVSRNIIENSDFKVTIAGNPLVESLNASVSAAILLYYFADK